jgi:hypothetical protein
MSEEKISTLTARIIHSEKKDVIDKVERTISFLKESDDEQIETKSLDDVINEFIQRIVDVCEEKKVVILNLGKVYDELAIGFALSSRLSNEKSPNITIDIPVTDAKESVEKHEQD